MSGGFTLPGGPPGPYANARAATAVVVALFMAVLVVAHVRGTRGRVFLPDSHTVPVRAARYVLDVWRDAGVRGRILLAFDRYPHFTTYYSDYQHGAPVKDGDFIEYAVYANVVRKIIVVIREEEWDALARQPELYRPIRPVPGRAKALILDNPAGITVIAATPSSLPDLSEKALVYVNTARFSLDEAAGIMSRQGLKSDLVVALADGRAP